MPPNLPSLFMPRRPHPQPTSPTSSQPRVGVEELKRELMQSDPELYRNEGPFGHIPGIPVFSTWENRDECAKARMHTSTTAGISGGKNGAYSIVMSGGYEDVDKGETIIYTGTGGYGDENRYGGGNNRSWGANIQIEDQSFEHKDNNALYMSYRLSRPVRVIRGYKLRSEYAPKSGYRYDGIYRVTNAYMDKSRDGVFQLCRYELVREPGQPPLPTQ